MDVDEISQEYRLWGGGDPFLVDVISFSSLNVIRHKVSDILVLSITQYITIREKKLVWWTND